MSEGADYEKWEIAEIREIFASGGAAMCPRCQIGMTRRDIGGGSFGLGYDRKRTWLICPKCRRSAIFDVKRGTRN